MTTRTRAADAAIVEHVRELFAPAGAVAVRAMFGGHGVYVDGVMCAIVFDGRVFLKVDDATRARFADAGGTPFVYTGQKLPIELGYWTVPESAFDSAEEMAPWLTLARAAAGRKAAARKPAKAKRATRPGK